MLKQYRTPWLGKESDQRAWYIYWNDPIRRRCRRCSTGTVDRLEAEVALGKFLVERSADITIERIKPPEAYLIATALQLYLKERGKELRSLDYAVRATKSLIKFFGPRAKVSNITPQFLKRYEHERTRRPRALTKKEGIVFVKDERPVTKGTIRRELGVLASALNHAVKYRRLTTYPPIHKPAPPKNRERFLNKTEIQGLISNCLAPHIKLFVILAVNTGSRKGALLDLKWDQVDLVNRLVFLNPYEREQTTKYRATVPINDALYDVLVKAKLNQETYLQKRNEKVGEAGALCKHVISFNNRPVKSIRMGFMRACDRAGIEDTTPHTLRHTAGTLMALAGVDFFLISKVLGHSMQTTTELYAHFAPEHLRRAVGVLGEAMPMT